MAREIFPDFEPGQRLTAAHVNLLNKAARVVMNIKPSAYTFGGLRKAAGTEPHQQRVVIVKDATVSSNVVIGLRYYDETASEWKTDDSGDHLMDVESVGSQVSDGDLLSAWWDRQRERWIPLCTPSPEPDDCPSCFEGLCVDDLQEAEVTEESRVLGVDGSECIGLLQALPCGDVVQCDGFTVPAEFRIDIDGIDSCPNQDEGCQAGECSGLNGEYVLANDDTIRPDFNDRCWVGDFCDQQRNWVSELIAVECEFKQGGGFSDPLEFCEWVLRFQPTGEENKVSPRIFFRRDLGADSGCATDEFQFDLWWSTSESIDINDIAEIDMTLTLCAPDPDNPCHSSGSIIADDECDYSNSTIRLRASEAFV